MKYFILGTVYEIYQMNKPDGFHGSVYEFIGCPCLNEIGLNEKFYFRCNHGFNNILEQEMNFQPISVESKTALQILSHYLELSIRNRKLTSLYN